MSTPRGPVSVMRSRDVISILIAGEGGVGKSTLVKNLITGSYHPQTLTVGLNVETWTYEHGGRKRTVTIMDAGGEERFQFLLPSWARGTSGCILAFDLGRFISFLHLPDWLGIVLGAMKPDRVLLVGTKADLGNDREVPGEHAEAFARDNGLIGYVETSAKMSMNVVEAFQILLERINIDN
ncbi:MAG: GTP-binding protein [Candidatus Thorarchaeota archaeon]|nr:GTP-binding protein [Candidatus Thorarchaeota archaeon]